MQELDELQQHHEALAQRGARLVAISSDGLADTARTQERFPNLIILSDPSRQTLAAFQSVHAGMGPSGEDIAAPTTFLIDRAGQIRYHYRPERFIERLPVAKLLQAVEQHLPAQDG